LHRHAEGFLIESLDNRLPFARQHTRNAFPSHLQKTGILINMGAANRRFVFLFER